jgi:hypothetical protein
VILYIFIYFSSPPLFFFHQAKKDTIRAARNRSVDEIQFGKHLILLEDQLSRYLHVCTGEQAVHCRHYFSERQQAIACDRTAA